MSKPLSKSLFKVGIQCPTKLFYSVRKEYGNTKDQNEFLKALAEGGFQVGELAQLYYPGGIKVNTLDYEKSIQETEKLLKQDEVIIYEAAFQFETLFIRVDVISKKGNEIELTEVKAKSFDSNEEFSIFDKRSLKKNEYVLNKKWGEYVMDLAFQTYVLKNAKPQYKVNSGLMLADKSKKATVDGLNQLFLIQKTEDGKVNVHLTRKVELKDLGEKVLLRKDLTEEVKIIMTKAKMDWGASFNEVVKNLAKIMESNEKYPPLVGGHCKTCEFKLKKKQQIPPATKSGFEECWSQAKNLSPNDFEKEFVFDVWDFRNSEKVIESGAIFASDLTQEDLKVKERDDDQLGFSRTERQWTQVQFAKGNLKGVLVHTKELAQELKSFRAPYHFIDFETAMVAIPFHKGRRPYEQMAYQFSHHMIDKDGKQSHRTEYLDDRKGVFPNYDFVRALKKALDQDDGTIFRFAAHENTVLNQIRQQLLLSDERDRKDLIAWIETLTSPPDELEGEWEPIRQFIDMRELTLRFYYLPETHGSNSIKKILPAILNYAGKELLPKFPEHISFDLAGRTEDPYKYLPPIFNDIPAEDLAKIEMRLIEREDLNDGGAAMLAWARMQFTEMSNLERRALREALLRYCKLDTLAMVMIWEWWQLEIARFTKKAA